MKSSKKWYARCVGIAKMGPYSSYDEAAAALINTKGLPVEGAFVWPETKAQTKAYEKLAREAEKTESMLTSLHSALADECARRGMKMPRKRQS
jgi:hypothetical protein